MALEIKAVAMCSGNGAPGIAKNTMPATPPTRVTVPTLWTINVRTAKRADMRKNSSVERVNGRSPAETKPSPMRRAENPEINERSLLPSNPERFPSECWHVLS